MSTDPGHEDVGFGKPPKATQFRKGQSGNPRGRPRNRHREIPYDAVLGQMVTVREDGRERRVTAAEAFLLQLTQKGLAGDSASARASLEAIETARAKRNEDVPHITKLIWSVVGNGADAIIGPLGIATRKYPTDEERMRWELNPWVVEAALQRLGDRRLSIAEQKEVWENAHQRHKVAWPDWWKVGEG